MTTLTAATPTAGNTLLPVHPGRGAPPPPSGISGADYLRIIRHRLVLILVLWAFFSALAAGFTWFMGRYFPKYYAYALVRVKSVEPVSPLNPLEQREIRQQEVELLVQNQALIVKSPHVLEDVLKDPQIKTTEWWAWAREQKDEDPIDLLADDLSAVPIRDSNFLKVGMSWRIRSEVAVLANKVVDKYLEKVNMLQETAIRESRDRLVEELDMKQHEFQAKREELEDLQATAEIWGVTPGGPSEQLLTLQALMTELVVETLGRQTQYEALKNIRPEEMPVTAELQAILRVDPMIMRLDALLQEAEAGLDLAEDRFGENHPIVKNAKAVRDSAAESAAEERAVKLLRYQVEQIEASRRNWLEAQEQLIALAERLNEAEEEQRDKDANYARYLRLVEERDLLRMQYEVLLEQRSLLDMTLRQRSAVQIDVPSRAVEPRRRSSPRWEIWMPAGVMLGLLVSVGFALLLEFADKSVRTPRDVARVPVLGSIPTIDDDEVEIERVETASIDAPHSIVAEAFRNLRANLFFSAPAEQQSVIMVTSPSGGNGKTTVAINLGISIALSGRRVLLIDTNFRRPGLPRVFPCIPEEGLSNILIGQGHLADLVVSSSVPGLDILGPGPAPPNPAELLGSSYLRDVVVDARSRYDQVILDGPPILLVSDALVLAGAVDGVLVVCQYRATSRGAFQRSQAQLDAINARVFGAVLNMVATRAGGYFRKAYREFYEYHEVEDEPGGGRPPRLDAQPAEGQLHASRETKTKQAARPNAPPAKAVTSSDTALVKEQHPGASAAKESSTEPEIDGPEDSGTTKDQADGRDEQKGASPGTDQAADADRDGPSFTPPGLRDEIKKIDSDQTLDDDLGIEEDFKIDGDFDLGEDFEDPGWDDDKPGH